MNYLDMIVASHRYPPVRGIFSVCSAHPQVIEATLRYAHRLPGHVPVLIESTCNQVNPFGGYTGMKPADFVRFVHDMAERVHLPRERVLLGGDHLGPLPWSNEPPEQAMAKARDLVRAYVRAGYTKIHLDCSMPLGGETTVSLETIAERTALLAQVAEETAGDRREELRYIIGSEVPTAGGARAGEEEVHVTTPKAAMETLEATREAFRRYELAEAWERVVGLVVQPGVEFGNDFVHEYDRDAAAPLSRFIEGVPHMVYEAHSTDYQPREALRALVEDHFAILKVGPALTFAFREAVFALAAIEEELGVATPSHLREVIDRVMVEDPRHWQRYYPGAPEAQRLARAYSFSDRIRYYWPHPRVQDALRRLLANLEDAEIPPGVLSQYFPKEYHRVRSGQLPNRPQALIFSHITDVLEDYAYACGVKSYAAGG